MAGIVPDNPNTLLRRAATAAALTQAGYPTAPTSLATKVTRGGGPPYRLFGRVPLYRWGDVLSWAEGRLSPPLRSTAEADLLQRVLPRPIAAGAAKLPSDPNDLQRGTVA
jgi:hypothetical protein